MPACAVWLLSLRVAMPLATHHPPACGSTRGPTSGVGHEAWYKNTCTMPAAPAKKANTHPAHTTADTVAKSDLHAIFVQAVGIWVSQVNTFISSWAPASLRTNIMVTQQDLFNRTAAGAWLCAQNAVFVGLSRNLFYCPRNNTNVQYVWLDRSLQNGDKLGGITEVEVLTGGEHKRPPCCVCAVLVGTARVVRHAC